MGVTQCKLAQTGHGGGTDGLYTLVYYAKTDKAETNPDNGLAEEDYFETTQITRGFLSNGISFSSVLFGGTGNDNFTVYSNKAELFLFGDEEKMIRIDMSEYMEKISSSRLIGTAPGYVGYNDQNQLTDEVRKNPYSLVLLDEIEKADSQMTNLFLQVFDAGSNLLVGYRRQAVEHRQSLSAQGGHARDQVRIFGDVVTVDEQVMCRRVCCRE